MLSQIAFYSLFARILKAHLLIGVLTLSETHGVGFSPSTGCDRGSLRGVWPAGMEESNQDPGGSCSSRPTRWVQGGKAACQLTDDNRATTSMRVNKTAWLVQVKVSLVRCSWEGWQPSHEERIAEFLDLDSKPGAMYWVEKGTLRVPVLLWKSKTGDDVHIQRMPLHFKHQKEITIKWNSSLYTGMFVQCLLSVHKLHIS